MNKPPPLLIGIVGPCKSGKSVLKAGLEKHGYRVKHIAQEHSFVPSMWQKLTDPDVLIFLEVSFEESLRRYKLNWTQRDYDEQTHRLRHARQHADLVLNTTTAPQEEVLGQAAAFINSMEK